MGRLGVGHARDAVAGHRMRLFGRWAGSGRWWGRRDVRAGGGMTRLAATKERCVSGRRLRLPVRLRGFGLGDG